MCLVGRAEGFQPGVEACDYSMSPPRGPSELAIDKKGHVIDVRVRLAIAPQIERGPLTHVRGIIVHQTGSATASATMNSYMNPSNGAHFLIDKDGTIYHSSNFPASGRTSDGKGEGVCRGGRQICSEKSPRCYTRLS